MLPIADGAILLYDDIFATVMPLILLIPGNTAGGAAAVTTGEIVIILAKSPLVNVLLPNPMNLAISPLFNVILAIIHLPLS